MYIQRYIPRLPAGGEVVIFDRSWYNRAGVERVMGFCKPAETERFLELVAALEKAMIQLGNRLSRATAPLWPPNCHSPARAHHPVKATS